MNYEDVQKVSNAAKAKSNLVNTNFFKYFIHPYHEKALQYGSGQRSISAWCQ